MKILSTGIFELAARKNISNKHVKLLVLCSLLLCIKFVIMPVIEWQFELKEEINFYNLQYRDEDSIRKSSDLIIANKDKVVSELNEIKNFYSSGAVTVNQVKMNDLIDQKIAELELSLSSKNSRKLYEKDGVITIEYLVRARGTAAPLQEFIYWLDNVKPKLLINNTRFSSSRGSSIAEVNVRFHQLILSEQTDE